MPAPRLTMTAIAEELGVSAGALYRYFPDRQSILEALAAEKQALLEPPDPSLGWREWLTEELNRERAMWASHPELVEVASMPAVIGPANEVFDVGQLVLQREGFSAEDALYALTAASALAFGLNMMVTARNSVAEMGDHDSPAGEKLHEMGVPIDLDSISAALVEIMLDGLAHRLPRRRGRRN